MRGVTTFGAFTTARLGIYAAQKGLDVAGHNIANINTEGYTRQSLQQVSLRTGNKDMYTSIYDAGTGSGALVTGISQLRDPFLDIRFRTEQASVGSLNVRLSGLNEISGILDEVGANDGDGILEAQFNDLVKQLQNLNTEHATENEYDSLVRSSADSLTRLFNNYAERLEKVAQNESESFKQDISNVNDILKNLQSLNDDIMSSEIHGDSALEMKDQRNLLLDQLSSYMKINVTYQPVSIGAGAKVDKLVIKTAGDTPRLLVDGGYATQLSLRENTPQLNPEYTGAPGSQKYLDAAGNPTDDAANAAMVADTNYDLDLAALQNSAGKTLAGSEAVALSDTELYGGLQSSRELLTEKGEFTTAGELMSDANAASKRGIPYYQNALDALARKFATVLNEANTGYLKDSGGFYLYKNGAGELTRLTKADGSALALEDMSEAQKATLLHTGKSGVLFSNGRDNLYQSGDADYNAKITEGITAANLTVSKLWNTGTVRIQNSYVQGAEKGETVNSSDNSNILHIISLMDSRQSYKPSDTVTGKVSEDDPFFEGSFQQMFNGMQATLAQDVKSTNTLLNNFTASASELNTSRDSVSGVDLNDEAMSMMTYQKSYAAACRLMTTLDEALNTLINNTGMVGR